MKSFKNNVNEMMFISTDKRKAYIITWALKLRELVVQSFAIKSSQQNQIVLLFNG